VEESPGISVNADTSFEYRRAGRRSAPQAQSDHIESRLGGFRNFRGKRLRKTLDGCRIEIPVHDRELLFRQRSAIND
jgi:hypothetical protein